MPQLMVLSMFRPLKSVSKILIAARGVCTLLRINGDSWDVAVVNIDCYFRPKMEISRSVQ